ncbi:Superfamily I DNA and RNA helicases [Singulisphaera sp. GP187]|uniref:3'-5' exonuclease n=1 Tax=Singulisphaera sp. GP187 TaxID=1882752 RepID=UPI000927BAF7|nr:nuclease-related domain-containing DEAD/DEAH box helicase [Singulisphaera sp. GP187]SIO61375.1 Superfamily I DNA and RNA helicases [Singulisphaera sp. GP187]
MAILIPDTCPSKATVGEKRVYGLLRDALPDNYTAWYEPVVGDRRPDFTLLADDFGLIVLEVKGWYAGQIARATDQEVELHRTEGGETQVEMHKNPIRQVRDYLNLLMDKLARPEYAILRQPEGEHRGKPCFPWGFGVILTNITRAQLRAAKLSELFPPDKVICRDELTSMDGAGDRAVIRRLKAMFPAPFPFDPLTEDQVKTVKGVLHKEVIVRRRPATAASVPKGQLLLPGAVALDVLDAHQEQVARSLGDGHHIVFGVAGSGKTVLILARAQLIALQDAAKKVLILCYNKALAADLVARLGPHGPKNIEIRHFHSWVARKTGLRKRQEESFDDYERRLVDAMLRGADHWTEAEKYDAILIDEAHDFEPDWFRCATSLLRDGPVGDILIAADGAQSLYGRDRKFTWLSVGVQARGRSRRLTHNYRNTKQILEFAWQVAQSTVKDDAESETLVRLVPTRVLRRGPVPCYRGSTTIEAEHALIAKLVQRYREKGIAAQDIAVLYPRNERGRIDALCQTLRRSGEVSWISNEADPGGGVRALAQPGVRLATVHAAKGLEFRAVILCALDLLPNRQQIDEVRDSNLLYVGLTRATDELIVTWAGRSAFTDRLPYASKAILLTDV